MTRLVHGDTPMSNRIRVTPTGYTAPVRVKYITDVTKLGRGNLSNEILRSVDTTSTGCGAINALT